MWKITMVQLVDSLRYDYYIYGSGIIAIETWDPDQLWEYYPREGYGY